ncbi:elongation of very long chain fatty acids protein 2 [Biomphalaria glabrata]|uniref:Elongation of very long chain fatty acids protein n=1 Tax=Biomphalaria glabrata TaxID=6526 RepID=A0A9W3AIE3_BIOGL|nr:elongation of very long chain fatty acids protein 4-like isoform X1 [Biomphalaria glabrata]XP_055886910.1 elongation of very long chain fatty acids protein 4-like isoform X1 [Biomphalaria glabrata]KAI8754612.1 elongation of very long chain fatty acids protein 2-like [Biomphalaria glabrata]KAI8773241.1 elongation of very long chain fatty acids protein 2 [Biomphalaria glabrata]
METSTLRSRVENLFGYINEKYNLTPPDVFYGDPRVSDWPFMNNLTSILSIVFLYLLMVKLGPVFMAKRSPMNVTYLLVAYNFAMVIWSFCMCLELVIVLAKSNQSLLCRPVKTDVEIGLREARLGWWCFMSKIAELLDTVFFIVRKKNNQLSFLHVYHHSSMVLICWYFIKYLPGGEKLYNGGINSFVHVIMYTYYGLSAMGPHYQKYIWWKRYLTQFQICQFVCISLRCIGTFFYGPCEYPKWTNVGTLLYVFSNLLLFLNFYIKSYKSKSILSSHSASKSTAKKSE